MLGELFGLVLLIALVAIALGGGARWIGRFADLLWLFAINAKVVALAVLIVILIAALPIHFLLHLPLVSSLSMTIMLIVLPFAAIPLANRIARIATLAKWYDPRAWPKTGWKDYIFDERRLEQSRAYEAPRAAQDWMPEVSFELEGANEPAAAEPEQPKDG